MNLRKQYVTVVTYMIKLHLLLQSPEFHEHFGERRCTVPRTVSEGLTENAGPENGGPK